MFIFCVNLFLNFEKKNLLCKFYLEKSKNIFERKCSIFKFCRNLGIFCISPTHEYVCTVYLSLSLSDTQI